MSSVAAAQRQLVYKASQGMEPAACLRTLFGVQSAADKGLPEKLSQLGREHSHIGRTQRYPELTVKVCFAEMPHLDFYKAWQRVQDLLVGRLNIRQREEDDKLILQTVKRAYKKHCFFITAKFRVDPLITNAADMEFAAKLIPEDTGLEAAIGNLFSETESYINGFKQAQTELFPEPKNGDAATLKVM